MSHAVQVNIHATGLDMRVLGGFIQGEYRGEAGITALKQVAPFLSRFPGESSLKNLPLFGPQLPIGMRPHMRDFRDAKPVEKEIVKFLFHRPDSNVQPITGPI
jgi:hypothetical protein